MISSRLPASQNKLSLFTLVSYLSTVCRGMVSSGKVIDSHLHVWADKADASKQYPWIQEPPDGLKDQGSTEELIKEMDANGVDGALIVQPINHEFDHSYILETAIQKHPQRFKAMMLHNPAQSTEDAVSKLEELVLQGCVGVRFNPYLWPQIPSDDDDHPQWQKMSECPAGVAVYKRCGELQMPVGVMCFKGIELHYEDIMALYEASPGTKLILDHFGFTNVNNQDQFDKLVSLAKYPQVYVKISALFRLGDDSPNYDRVRDERFLPLLKAFGSERLMYGSDFPFVLEQDKGYGTVKLVSDWTSSDEDRKNVLGGTAERLFGPWGVPENPPPKV